MVHFLGVGLLLGLSAGLAPGPLLTLVIAETLQKDVGAGIRVALAPLVSDLPIILVSVYALSAMSDFNWVLGIISIVGGCVVFHMGMGSIRTKGVETEREAGADNALAKGVMVNVLSPHPYLFWVSVGAPTVYKAMDVNMGAAAMFILGFYILLVGSKVGLAVAAGRSRNLLKGRAYVYTMRGLGAALCLLALFLFKDGLSLLGAI